VLHAARAKPVPSDLFVAEDGIGGGVPHACTDVGAEEDRP
jgi:hypothetical protein